MWKQTGRVEIAVLNLLKEMYLNKKKTGQRLCNDLFSGSDLVSSRRNLNQVVWHLSGMHRIFYISDKGA